MSKRIQRIQSAFIRSPLGWYDHMGKLNKFQKRWLRRGERRLRRKVKDDE